MDIVVIGNGFDLAHKLKTSYSDFQTYLYDEYQLAIDDFDDCFPEFISDSDGGNYVPLDIAAALLYSLITNADGIKWSDVENSLEYFNFTGYFDHVDQPLDKEGDINYAHYETNLHSSSSGIRELVQKLPELLNEWIENVKIDKYYQIRIRELYKCENKNRVKYVSFNYTDTLETLYNISRDNILYLHGKRGTYEKLIFGHGSIRESDNDPEMQPIFGEIDFYLDGVFDQAIELMKKNTKAPLNKLLTFLNGEVIDNVYFYGFSFSEVDMIYVKAILRLLSKDSIIYLNDYFDSNESYAGIANTIKEFGFNGEIKKVKFTTFHPNALFQFMENTV